MLNLFKNPLYFQRGILIKNYFIIFNYNFKAQNTTCRAT
ncbi:hypothetical protein LEP1GSC186_3997 [Leptospira noguchii serovar Autumnalis str. ZUN142]|uniref:Uncharacterized protein n=1 Tax=Leptospira noguchii serovar Autumnalis str. ZUN142 TaxID=1085540 RepID=M6UBQ5_9LEPT|nr:hypothetical protein LEP1GSC186_3997 [Leptospira noguchii serovar Autumnalis str. ZUN142]